jgi:hypothetical protein
LFRRQRLESERAGRQNGKRPQSRGVARGGGAKGREDAERGGGKRTRQNDGRKEGMRERKRKRERERERGIGALAVRTPGWEQGVARARLCELQGLASTVGPRLVQLAVPTSRARGAEERMRRASPWRMSRRVLGEEVLVPNRLRHEAGMNRAHGANWGSSSDTSQPGTRSIMWVYPPSMCVRVSVRPRVRVSLCPCVHVSVCPCVCVRPCVRASVCPCVRASVSPVCSCVRVSACLCALMRARYHDAGVLLESTERMHTVSIGASHRC